MSEKRFTLSYPISHNPIPSWVNIIHDDMKHKHLNAKEIMDLLNEQQNTINNQEQKIKILQQEINDTQAILQMLAENLRGWSDD